MKRIRNIIILFILLFLSSFEVMAKDTVYSLNKYQKEDLDIIIRSYKEKNVVEGFITAGTVLNNEEKEQPIIINYKKTGSIKWIYTHPTLEDEKLLSISYTYQNNQVDGYLLLLKTKEKELLVKVDLEGILSWEKEIEPYFEKILIISNDNNEPIYYIMIGNDGQSALIDRYSLDLESISKKYYPTEGYQTNFQDIIKVNDNRYAAIYIKQSKEETIKELWMLELESEETTLINSSIEKNIYDQLISTDDGFALFGITEEVKIKKGQASYYLIKYNQDGVNEWESIGDTPVNNKKPIKILHKSNQYYILYENNDKSKEVILLNPDGTYNQKVKKINNDYYSFNNFYIVGKTIYFVGQIQCAEEDDCQNDSSSLFLISDEDKVIEVEDNTSTGILIIFSAIILLPIIVIVFKKRKK